MGDDGSIEKTLGSCQANIRKTPRDITHHKLKKRKDNVGWC
jgi:hypothetical protein